jgi:hypothetical protein
MNTIDEPESEPSLKEKVEMLPSDVSVTRFTADADTCWQSGDAEQKLIFREVTGCREKPEWEPDKAPAEGRRIGPVQRV